MKFRKKPVEIEAVKFDGWNWAECYQFMSDEVLFFPQVLEEREKIEIKTLEGTMTASRGDWIIKGVNGEFYPCKPDIFQKTYDIVEG
jgi:hypothetical protein